MISNTPEPMFRDVRTTSTCTFALSAWGPGAVSWPSARSMGLNASSLGLAQPGMRSPAPASPPAYRRAGTGEKGKDTGPPAHAIASSPSWQLPHTPGPSERFNRTPHPQLRPNEVLNAVANRFFDEHFGRTLCWGRKGIEEKV